MVEQHHPLIDDGSGNSGAPANGNPSDQVIDHPEKLQFEATQTPAQ